MLHANAARWGLSRNLLRYKAMTHGDVSEYLFTQACSECNTFGGPQGAEGLVIREWSCAHCQNLFSVRGYARL